MLLHPPPLAPPQSRSKRQARWANALHGAVLLGLWAVVYLLSVSSPALLDDADATHAQAAQAMLRTGDWVTLHVDGIRYLEKAPLPYWIAAVSLRLFGNNSFAVHLPLALTVLGLAMLARSWGERVFDPRTGFYAALFTLTGAGTFLFTRIFIPDALLSLLLGVALFCASRALEPDEIHSLRWAGAGWVALAVAVLTKGLVAIVFCCGALAIYFLLTRTWRHWRCLHPGWGFPLFLAVAAPWHLLAGLRNRGGANGHGFFWFYFINEHVLRFLGRRVPADYNKLPGLLYWSLHLVWLFPWSLFAPVALWRAWQSRASVAIAWRRRSWSKEQRNVLLLTVFSAVILLFFAFSTNQEYYTLPVYVPLLILIAAALSRLERDPLASAIAGRGQRLLLICHGLFFVLGTVAAAVLGFALWISRKLPAAPDIGDLFVHRGVGDYTLSMSHLFDLTGASFSALRLPATLACVAFALGPALGLVLRARKQHVAATVTVAATSALFLVAAHLALIRFAPMLSSQDFAETIQNLRRRGAIAPDAEILMYGDQALGSSLPFYLQQQVELVNGRSTSMLFGSTFPDAPHIFETGVELKASWGTGRRKLLFVPLEHYDEVHALLGTRPILLKTAAGKELLTDQPLDMGDTGSNIRDTGLNTDTTLPPWDRRRAPREQ